MQVKFTLSFEVVSELNHLKRELYIPPEYNNLNQIAELIAKDFQDSVLNSFPQGFKLECKIENI